MIRRILPLLAPFVCFGALALVGAPVRANEASAGAEAQKPAAEAKPQGVRQVPIRKPVLSSLKPLPVDGVRGVETFCGAIASSAASARLAWQEQRIKALQAELTAKIVELDAKTAEVRQWVQKREQFLAKASDNLTAIFVKMKPEAASAQLQAMDDDVAAALLAKLKPSVAGAVMGEMDPARAARLSDLLSAAKSDGKKS